MFLRNSSLFFFALLFGSAVSAQIYLSKEAPKIEKKWNENTFTSEKSFGDNIKEAQEFTFLSKILADKALTAALDGQEMVTIFAVSDAAFSKLDKKQRDSLLGDKRLMASMVNYLTVPGRIDRHGLEKEAGKRNGTFFLATLNGENLGVFDKDGQLYLVDPQGRRATITKTDFYHKNGLFHIIDGLVFPETKE